MDVGVLGTINILEKSIETKKINFFIMPHHLKYIINQKNILQQRDNII